MGGFHEFITSNADARRGGELTDAVLQDALDRILPPPENVPDNRTQFERHLDDLLRTDPERLRDRQVQAGRDPGIVYGIDPAQVPLLNSIGTRGRLEWDTGTIDFVGQNTATITVGLPGVDYGFGHDRSVADEVQFYQPQMRMNGFRQRRPLIKQAEYVKNVLECMARTDNPHRESFIAFKEEAERIAREMKANPECLLEASVGSPRD